MKLITERRRELRYEMTQKREHIVSWTNKRQGLYILSEIYTQSRAALISMMINESIIKTTT